jgi:hypothetical protein
VQCPVFRPPKLSSIATKRMERHLWTSTVEIPVTPILTSWGYRNNESNSSIFPAAQHGGYP